MLVPSSQKLHHIDHTLRHRQCASALASHWQYSAFTNLHPLHPGNMPLPRGCVCHAVRMCADCSHEWSSPPPVPSPLWSARQDRQHPRWFPLSLLCCAPLWYTSLAISARLPRYTLSTTTLSKINLATTYFDRGKVPCSNSWNSS